MKKIASKTVKKQFRKTIKILNPCPLYGKGGMRRNDGALAIFEYAKGRTAWVTFNDSIANSIPMDIDTLNDCIETALSRKTAKSDAIANILCRNTDWDIWVRFNEEEENHFFNVESY